ncbi:MAG: NUDIX hydrolase [Anaerolineae bacterium]
MRPEEQRDRRQRYTVVPRVLIFLTRGEQVLLLKGAPTKRLWANRYNGLGGHVEPDETPYQAALREVREESGLTPDTLTLRAIVHVTMPQPPGVVLFVFVGEASQGVPHPSAEGEPTWIARDALVGLPLVEDLYALLPRVLAPGDVIFGHYRFTDEGAVFDFTP